MLEPSSGHRNLLTAARANLSVIDSDYSARTLGPVKGRNVSLEQIRLRWIALQMRIAIAAVVLDFVGVREAAFCATTVMPFLVFCATWMASVSASCENGVPFTVVELHARRESASAAGCRGSRRPACRCRPLPC